MGAFCVFGVSKGLCKTKAERKVPTHDKDLKRESSPAEWAVRRDAYAAQLFEQADRPVRISPEFDAPQFCSDWLAVSPGEVKLARVMVRGPKVDKNGKPVVKGGAPVLTWVEYTPQVKAAA
jgi:hypothetical protein